ncbi:MAG: hypothetical protein ACXVYY_10795 [Oryzihumus sp.]
MSEAERMAQAAITEVREALVELQASVAEVQAMTDREGRELRELREQLSRQDEERADAARRGELGPQWQRLQRRIDLGETSVHAILTGKDESADADLLRATAMENTRSLAVMQEDELDDEDPTNETFAAVRQDQAELQALLAEIRSIPRSLD